jgi:hypothetical protein
VYLNPENTVPNQGLTSLGVTVPLGQGFINQRMADARKMQMQLSKQNGNFKAIAVLYDASIARFNWKKTTASVIPRIQSSNAQIRLQNSTRLHIRR